MAKVVFLFFLNHFSSIKSDTQDSYKYWYVDLEGFFGYRFSDRISIGMLGGVSLYLDPVSTSDLTSKTYLAGMYFLSEIYDNFLLSNVWVQLNYGYNKYYNHFNFLVLFKPVFFDLPFSIGVSFNNNYCKNEILLKKPSVSLVLCADISKNTRKFNYGAKVYGRIIGDRSLNRSSYYNCVSGTLKDSYDSLENIALDPTNPKQEAAKQMKIYLNHSQNTFIAKQVISSLKNRECLDNLCDAEIHRKAVLCIKKPEVLSVELGQYRSKLPFDDNILGKNIMMLEDYLWFNGLSSPSAKLAVDFTDKNRFIDIYSGLLDIIPFVDTSRSDYHKDLFGIFNYIQSSLRLLKDDSFVSKVRENYSPIIANKTKDKKLESLYIGMGECRLLNTCSWIRTLYPKGCQYTDSVQNVFADIEKFIKEKELRINELIDMIDNLEMDDKSLLLNKNLPRVVAGFDAIFGELSEKEHNMMKKIDTIFYGQETYLSKLKGFFLND